MDLARMFGDGQSILGQQLGLQKFDQDMTTGTINNANTLQSMFQNHQMNPLKVEHQRLLNEQLPVQTAGMRTDNQQRQLNYDKDFATKDSDVALKLRGNEVDQEKMNVNMFLAQAERMAMDQNPRIRALGEDILKHSNGYLKTAYDENLRADRELEKIRATGDEQRKTWESSVASGGRRNYNNPAQGGGGKPFNMSQWEASMRLRAMQGDEEAINALAALQEERESRAAAATVIRGENTQRVLGDEPAPRVDPRSRYNPPAAASSPMPAARSPSVKSIINPQTGERLILSPDGKSWIKG